MSSEMNINRTNYESWFLDYFEGSLSAEQEAEIEGLKKIKAQPKKLIDEIAKREARIAAGRVTCPLLETTASDFMAHPLLIFR